jgi:hypothetical protein
MTLETLATVKNPKVLFATHANFGRHQQVNNNAASARRGNLKSRCQTLR